MSILSHGQSRGLLLSCPGDHAESSLRIQMARGRHVAKGTSLDPWKQLVAEIIRRAIRDYRRGRERRGDARSFLTSPYCAALFGYLGIDAGAAREKLGLQPGSSAETKPLVTGQEQAE